MTDSSISEGSTKAERKRQLEARAWKVPCVKCGASPGEGCWMAACEECGSDEVESEGGTHYPSRAEAEAGLERAHWSIIDGRVLCHECARDRT